MSCGQQPIDASVGIIRTDRRYAGPAALARAVANALARARQRRRLAQLDDRMLADIGVSRRVAEREARKAFWRR